MKRTPEGVIDFSQFKEKKEQAQQEETEVKPLFTQPTVITLGNPDDPEEQIDYNLLINLVRNDKQYLAMERKGHEGEIVVVEATTDTHENGKEIFTGVKIIDTEEEYEEVVKIVEDVFKEQQEAYIAGDNDVEGDTDGDY